MINEFTGLTNLGKEIRCYKHNLNQLLKLSIEENDKVKYKKIKRLIEKYKKDIKCYSDLDANIYIDLDNTPHLILYKEELCPIIELTTDKVFDAYAYITDIKHNNIIRRKVLIDKNKIKIDNDIVRNVKLLITPEEFNTIYESGNYSYLINSYCGVYDDR